jgi:hypothetical protein
VDRAARSRKQQKQTKKMKIVRLLAVAGTISECATVQTETRLYSMEHEAKVGEKIEHRLRLKKSIKRL